MYNSAFSPDFILIHHIFMRLLITLIIAAAAALGAVAQEADNHLFPYPVVPDSKTTLDQRCNYLLIHFWDRANVKQHFSTVDRLSQAFGDWCGFMPYATRDTVMLSIDRFIASVEKADPKRLGLVADIAAGWMQGDSAEYASDELYLPFARAAARAKKLDAASRAKYAAQVKLIEHSGLGMRVPDIAFTLADGAQGSLADVVASRVIILFADPDCLDCSLLKARLAADYNLKSLVDMGLVRVLVLYDADSDWQAAASSMPEGWTAAAAADLDTMFALPALPSIYYLDGRHRVLAKNVDPEGLLMGLRVIHEQARPSTDTATAAE